MSFKNVFEEVLITSFLVIAISAFCSPKTFAQNIRYIDEVFEESEITILKDLPYAENMSVEGVPFIHSVAQLVQLQADLYMPSVDLDNITQRPVVIISHSELLPRYSSRCFGAKDDLATVELAMTLAKRGYVVLCPEGRLGWQPLDPSLVVVAKTLHQALIRRAIDNRTAARWLRRTVVEDNNQFNIDPNKFIGTNTNAGGAISMYTGFYDTDEDFAGNQFKYIDTNGDTLSFYDRKIFGNLEGTLEGKDEFGNITNIVNHPDYSSEFQMMVIPGAWAYEDKFLENGTNPPTVISLAENATLNFLEYSLNPLVFPRITTSSHIARLIAESGANNEWEGFQFVNSFANMRFDYLPNPSRGEMEGMQLVGRDFDGDNIFPWAYWDTTLCNTIIPDFIDPDAEFPNWSVEVGQGTTETMLQYWLPRACLTLDLECQDFISSNQSVFTKDNIEIYPNPTQNSFSIRGDQISNIYDLKIFDAQGQIVFSMNQDLNTTLQIDPRLPNGIFFAHLKSTDGITVKKLIINH